MGSIDRRSLLLGALVVPLAGCGTTTTPTATADPERLVTGTFHSEFRKTKVGYSISYPPGSTPGDRLPVLVFLHGLHGDHNSAFGLGLQRWQRGFALATIDGGDSYYHPRPSGIDAGAMVLEEFLPLLHRNGLATHRIGLMGYSMGGYGALRLASILGPGRCAVAVAESPALWVPPSSGSPSGFADEQEYAKFTVFGRQSALAGIPVRIDCGTSDPFYAATRAFVAGFPTGQKPRPVVHYQPGGHDSDYWRARGREQLAVVRGYLTG